MPPEPFSWNAVVVGAWNLAILSPDGVRKRLFDLPDGTPIEIEIAIDRPGHFRVGSEGLLVIPTASRLEVTTRVPSQEALERACRLCQRALEGLPETPVSAAGVNVRYRFDELPDALHDLVRAPLDAALSDADFHLRGAETKRAVSVPPGIVNVQVTQADGGGTLEFNFHLDSASTTDISEWLGRVRDFIALSDRLAATLGVADVRREIHA